MLSNLAISPIGWAWQLGNKSAQKNKNPSQGRVRSDGYPGLFSSGPHLPFRHSHLARKQVGTANTVLDDTLNVINNMVQVKQLLSLLILGARC
jgi:hypothetical protein